MRGTCLRAHNYSPCITFLTRTTSCLRHPPFLPFPVFQLIHFFLQSHGELQRKLISSSSSKSHALLKHCNTSSSPIPPLSPAPSQSPVPDGTPPLLSPIRPLLSRNAHARPRLLEATSIIRAQACAWRHASRSLESLRHTALYIVIGFLSWARQFAVVCSSSEQPFLIACTKKRVGLCAFLTSSHERGNAGSWSA